MAFHQYEFAYELLDRVFDKMQLHKPVIRMKIKIIQPFCRCKSSLTYINIIEIGWIGKTKIRWNLILACTYSPCKQMVSFPNAISCAHNSCWPMIAFFRTLYKLVACFLCVLHLVAVLSIFEDQLLILALLHPMPMTLECLAVATIFFKTKQINKLVKMIFEKDLIDDRFPMMISCE